MLSLGLPNEDTLFDLFNSLICIPWLLLLIVPHWHWTRWVTYSVWPTALLLAGWLVLKLVKPPTLVGAGIFSFEQFQLLLQSPYTATLLWLQILIWDFFIGAWIVRDAKRHQIRHAWTIPALILTFISGPLGLIIYFLQRMIFKRSFCFMDER